MVMSLSGVSRQQRQQLRLNFADDLGALPGQQRRIADELNGVAKPLFGMEQNGLAGDRHLAQPQRCLGLRAMPGKRAGFPAPFICLPARIEIAHRKLRHRGFEMGFGKFRRCRQRRLEIRQRFDRPVKAAKRMAAIGQDLRMTGQACERVVVARHRLDRLVQSQQRIAPVDESADMTRRNRQHVIVVRQALRRCCRARDRRCRDCREFPDGPAPDPAHGDSSRWLRRSARSHEAPARDSTAHRRNWN